MNQYEAYAISLLEHIRNVQDACMQLKVSREQADVHDQSKFSPEEFGAYANYFWNADGTPKEPDQRTTLDTYDFTMAWNHHLNFNPHHWQHWIFPDGYAPELLVKEFYITKSGVMIMPDRYVLEMVADWMGASKSYTGSRDMSDWLKKNIKRITLHPHTANDLRQILYNLDSSYGDIVYNYNFKHELEESGG